MPVCFSISVPKCETNEICSICTITNLGSADVCHLNVKKSNLIS